MGAPDELTQLAYCVDLFGFFSLLLSSGTLFSKCCRPTHNFAEYSNRQILSGIIISKSESLKHWHPKASKGIRCSNTAAMEKLRTYFPQTERFRKHNKNKFSGESTQVGAYDLPSFFLTLLKHKQFSFTPLTAFA